MLISYPEVYVFYDGGVEIRRINTYSTTSENLITSNDVYLSETDHEDIIELRKYSFGQKNTNNLSETIGYLDAAYSIFLYNKINRTLYFANFVRDNQRYHIHPLFKPIFLSHESYTIEQLSQLTRRSRLIFCDNARIKKVTVKR